MNMITTALDRYNRTRPLGTDYMTLAILAGLVNEKMGKENTNSSITSMSQTFRRIDRGEQDSFNGKMLIALSDILKFTTDKLLKEFWIDNNTTNT